MYITTIKEKGGYKFESCQRWVHEKVRREEMEEKMIKLYYNLQNNLKIMCVYICVYVCPRNPEKNVGLLGSSRAGAGVSSCDLPGVDTENETSGKSLYDRDSSLALSSDLFVCLFVCLLAFFVSLHVYVCKILDIHIQ
jgi:hypothetical protein